MPRSLLVAWLVLVGLAAAAEGKGTPVDGTCTSADKGTECTMEESEVKIETELLLVINSAIRNQGQRMALRETWFKPSVFPARMHGRMFVGKTDDKKVIQEVKTHGDMVILNDIYANAGAKIKAMLLFAHENFIFTYLVKLEDEVYCKPSALYPFVTALPSSRLWYGKKLVNNPVVRDKRNQYYMPESMFSGDVFPPNNEGFGYVLSSDLVSYIHLARDWLVPVQFDDISLAIWFLALQVHPVHGGPDWLAEEPHLYYGNEVHNYAYCKESPPLYAIHDDAMGTGTMRMVHARYISNGSMCLSKESR